jgi:NADP-dependent 3-hydroxy acid dehydrogenase YdfG
VIDLKDQVLLITGATGGLGPTVARTAAETGARLALTARSASKLDELTSELGMDDGDLLAAPSDVTDGA